MYIFNFLYIQLMKHLRKYNEANAFHFDNDIVLIKEIILELKHEYPSIEGEITEESFEGENGGTFTIIKIKPMPIYNDESTKIPNIEKRLKYFNDIIECSKRLQEALDREVRVQDLFATKGDTVKIWIDDIKNKGKKWGNR